MSFVVDKECNRVFLWFILRVCVPDEANEGAGFLRYCVGSKSAYEVMLRVWM